MQLSDYVIKFLEERAVTDVFLVSGGGIMYLLDSLGRSSKIKYHCNYHEQASAVSAEGFARLKGSPGVCFATVGPGAVNAISGLVGAWVDSIPVLVVTGQVRTAVTADYSVLRQFGPQEANAVGMATPVTKYCVSVRNPKQIRAVLEQAFYQLTSGRPGPVLIEIPLDIQSAEIDVSELEGFTPPPKRHSRLDSTVFTPAVEILKSSRRPLFIAGNGIRLSGSVQKLERILTSIGCPVVLPFTAKDLIHENFPLFMGIFGTAGQRRANYAVQNADCVVMVGAGLNIQKVGFNVKDFARLAKKIVVDIDHAQLVHQAIKPDFAIEADAGEFLVALDNALFRTDYPQIDPRWLEVCNLWRSKYPPLTEAHFGDRDTVTSYALVDELSKHVSETDTIVCGNGIETVSIYQSFRVQPNQRLLLSGWGSMGWDLPLTFGAHVASEDKRVICICGDGSIQWNIQELLTISARRANVKILVFNNRGYAAIRTTQDSLFDSRYVGADPRSGVHNPDFALLAKAYQMTYRTIKKQSQMASVIQDMLTSQLPELVEVCIDPKQGVFPKASSFRNPDGKLESRPLEDMAPFLPREEQKQNMSFFD